ncbi:MAG: AEC family transporter [Anaerovibrio sp.]|uniref:AEC family transporter n=1 Tax=Anaerovibrio sp. TaxID=1872532 RepID=UPI0025D182ED|nr:AEC family transporter [Anaerovibrio sp.]MCR5176740.1 AEC family transporter [Anaerovibrio sp.]
MYSNFIVALEAVLPIAILISVGLLVKRMQLLSMDEIAHVNKLVFKVLFFCLLFQNMYQADFSIAFQPQLLLFTLTAILVTVAIACVIVCHFVKDNKKRGAMIHAIYRSNFIIIGIPVAANIYGHDKIAVTAMLITVVIPLYNILAVAIFETFRGNKIRFAPVLIGIAQNPMILGCITGIIFNLCQITIPASILKPIFQIGSATTPLALILLGASFTVSSVLRNKMSIFLCTAARLIIVPSIILPIAVWLGYRDIELVSIMTVFASPCAVVGFTMAQQMHSDYELAGNCIITTSGLSCLTIFGWIFLGKTLGLF